MDWVQALGWFGSALLVFSLLQARMLRLRALNTIACLILVVFNWVLGVWPMVAMNVVLAGINLYFIAKMVREQGDERAYQVLEVPETDRYYQHFLGVQAEQIKKFFPMFTAQTRAIGLGTRQAYLIQHGDETAGVVVVRDSGGGVAQVELDYVTPKFRDFTPGEFVYRRSGLFTARGFRRVFTPPGMVEAYYGRIGFERDGDRYRLDLPQPGPDAHPVSTSD